MLGHGGGTGGLHELVLLLVGGVDLLLEVELSSQMYHGGLYGLMDLFHSSLWWL